MAGIADGQLEPLQQVPALRQRVHERLESLIITGALRPGDRLVETELAGRLGVSRGPVREALQLLERDGWVDLRSRQGAFVHQPTDKEVDDFFDVRRVLETEAACLAAANVTPAQADRLREHLDAGRRVLAEGGDSSYVTTNATLHAQIARVAGNDILVQMLGLLGKRAAWYLRPLEMPRRQRAWEEHGEIVEAICARDAETAARMMAAHTDHSRESYKQLPSQQR